MLKITKCDYISSKNYMIKFPTNLTVTPNNNSRYHLQTNKVSTKVDLILSSGFQAFSKHAGFINAIEKCKFDVETVFGTSSGAIVGSLYCAGYKSSEIANITCSVPPIKRLRFNFKFWNGLFLLDNVIEILKEYLPEKFEDLEKNFGLSVVNSKLEYKVINSGPLAEAVAASAAVPCLFSAVDIPGLPFGPFADGGVKDRIGLNSLYKIKNYKNEQLPVIIHLIKRSSPFSGNDKIDKNNLKIIKVNSDNSKKTLLSLDGYEDELLKTSNDAMKIIQCAMKKSEKII